MDKDVKVGTRVHVLDTDQSDLGLGTYEGDVSFDADDNEIPPIQNGGPLSVHPKIKLDTGKVVYGFECWWTPTDEQFEVALAELERVNKPIN